MNRLETYRPSAPPTPTYATLPTALHRAPIDALYIHVPFCSSKCHYCDFYSLAGHDDRIPAYLTALAREIRLHQNLFGTPQPRTIFIGGGTPTLLSPTQLAQLLKLINNAIDKTHLHEFTVEANPNTFDNDRAKVLAAHGINRISFGAQSFNPNELHTLQRDHNPESIAPAMAAARNAGITNLNLDLIFGIPGQTESSWNHSLTRALELAPQHLSCYSLTYEPNTAMTARMQRGEFQKIDEDLELKLFEQVYQQLSEAGFHRYETSNYAKQKLAPGLPGETVQTEPTPRICHHNLAYWKAKNWLGWGPSAGNHIALPHSDTPTAHQWKNAGSLTHYLSALNEENPQLPITELESLSQKKWTAAAAIFWLRLDEGLNYKEFQQRTHTNIQSPLEEILTPFTNENLAELTPTHARITEKGVAVSNHILKKVLTHLESSQI